MKPGGKGRECQRDHVLRVAPTKVTSGRIIAQSGCPEEDQVRGVSALSFDMASGAASQPSN